MHRQNSSNPTSWLLTAGWLAWLLMVSGCATNSERPAPVFQPARVPAPPVGLMVPPAPPGSYLRPLTEWRRAAQQTLSGSPLKSEPFNATPPK